MVSNETASSNLHKTELQSSSKKSLENTEGRVKLGLKNRLCNIKALFIYNKALVEPTTRPINQPDSDSLELNLIKKSSTTSETPSLTDPVHTSLKETPKIIPDKPAALVTVTKSDTCSSSYQSDKQQGKVLLLGEKGYQYFNAKKNSDEYYLIDVYALKNERRKNKLSLFFQDGKNRRTSSLVTINLEKLGELTNLSRVLKITLNTTSGKKSFDVESGDMRTQRTWKSKNPLKALNKLINQARNPSFLLNNKLSKTFKTEPHELHISSKLIDQNLVEEKLKGIEKPELFWSIKMISSTGKLFNFKFPENISLTDGADFTRFVKSSKIFNKIAPLLPSTEFYFSNQENLYENKWRNQYDMPEFKTNGYMLPGEGKVVFHDPKTKILEKNYEATLDAFAHELGHVVAEQIYGKTSPDENSAYANAYYRDGDHASDYGRNNMEEDFAESVRCYLTQNTDFKSQNPNRYLAIDSIFKMKGDAKFFLQTESGFIEERLEI